MGVNRLLPRDRTEPRPHAQAAFGVGPGLIRPVYRGKSEAARLRVYAPQQATEPSLPLGYGECENAKCIFVPYYNVIIPPVAACHIILFRLPFEER